MKRFPWMNLLCASCLVLGGLLAACDGNTVKRDECTVANQDENCDPGEVCENGLCVPDTNPCQNECIVADECAELGACMACVDGCCQSSECASDTDCPPDGDLLRYCPDSPDPQTGCQECLYVRCDTDEECADPTFPLFPDCQAGSFPRCSRGTCICDVPCGGECPGNTFCCEPSNTCEPMPDPCAGVECPDCEEINPEPGGTINPETCVMDGADCSCQPLPPLDPAFAGQHSAIALGLDGLPVLSGYFAKPYGDLIYGTASGGGPGATVDWVFVDGVPADAPCEGAADGPRNGIAEPGDDVGWDSNLAVDGSNGAIHISYHDRTNGDLKYAHSMDGLSWQVHTVDEAGETGRFTSIALDNGGMPVIAYMVVRDGGLSKLKVAWATVTQPTVSTDWAMYEVDSITPPCRPGDCAAGEACLDTGACATLDDPANCAGGCAAGEVCVAAACEAEMADSNLVDIPAGVGAFASLDFFSDNSPMVVYYDSINGNLKAAVWNGTDAFGAPVVLDGQGGSNVGADCNLFIAADDTAHVVYQDADLGQLYYWNDGLGAAELVDMGARDANGDPTDLGSAVGELHWVGNFAKLVVDPLGNVRVAYQDGSSLDLVIAVRDAGGSWSAQILARKEVGPDFVGAYGFFVDQVLGETGETVHISNFKHNLRSDPWSSRIDLRAHTLP